NFLTNRRASLTSAKRPAQTVWYSDRSKLTISASVKPAFFRSCSWRCALASWVKLPAITRCLPVAGFDGVAAGLDSWVAGFLAGSGSDFFSAGFFSTGFSGVVLVPLAMV